MRKYAGNFQLFLRFAYSLTADSISKCEIDNYALVNQFEKKITILLLLSIFSKKKFNKIFFNKIVRGPK